MPKSSYQRTIIAWLLDHRFLVIAIVCIASIALLSPMRDPQVLFQESHDNSKQEDEEGSEGPSFFQIQKYPKPCTG